MKKIYRIKALTIISIVTMLVVFSTTSFVYWMSGIAGTEDFGDSNVEIGEGKIVETSVSLKECSKTAGRLIPYKIEPMEDETTQLTIEYKVEWISDVDPTGYLPKEDGILNVECSEIYVLNGDKRDDLIDVIASNDEPLFMIEILNDKEIVSNSNKSIVVINIKMNVPLNKQQYDLVAGENIHFKFQFSVTPKTIE